jgi:DNA polymerase-3 subunit gamma/tau
MSLALARKWRPRRFSDLVGQEHVVRALSNALTQGRLHHAWLFTGTRGVGKTTLARILAKCLNCETGVTAEPCGVCSACAQIDAGRFVDLLELDAASNTGVDNMREVLDNAMYAPTAGRYKVYIIDEVHMLSKSAFNSMLKTLEEPPEHVKFVLATTDPQRIPVTVLSRCLQFNLKKLPAALIAAHLAKVLEQEGVPAEPGALALLARAADGSMRDALSLLDQAIAHAAGALDEASCRAMLGLGEEGAAAVLLDALRAGAGSTLLRDAERLLTEGIAPDVLLAELAELLNRIAIARFAPEALAEDAPERARIVELAQAMDPEAVQLYYQIALTGRRDLTLAPSEPAGLSMTLLRMLAFTPGALPNAASKIAAPKVAARAEARPEATTRATPVAPASQPANAPGSTDLKSIANLEDWPAFVAGLGLSGMARMLAEHTVPLQREPRRLVLGVSATHAALAAGTHAERLKEAVAKSLGGLRVELKVQDAPVETPAAKRARDQAERQAQAVASIESDPFVRDLVEQFDARVIEDSIRPADEKAGARDQGPGTRDM